MTTTTTDNTQRMKDNIKRARADIASMTDWIELELDKTESEEIVWGAVGSVEHVRELMVLTLEFISGVDRDDIQRNLDELHG